MPKCENVLTSHSGWEMCNYVKGSPEKFAQNLFFSGRVYGK